MHKNIWKLYVMSAAQEALFLIGVVIPFFQENGMTLAEAFLLQGIFSAAMVVLEIPTGYLSDRWGRKNTLVAGFSFGVIGMFVYATSHAFWHFVLAEILLALLFSFQSGTTEALMYESLAEVGRKGEYRKSIGQEKFFGNMSQAIASVIGGFIAIASLRTTLWITLVPYVIGFLVSLTLKEPTRHVVEETSHMRAIWRVTTHTLVRDRTLRNITAFYSVFAMLTLVLMWFSQPYLLLLQIPLWAFGIVHAVVTVGMGVCAKLAHRAERYIDDRISLAIAGIAVLGSYLWLGMFTSLWGVVFLFLGRSMYGIFGTITSDLVNRIAPSSTRATILSAQSFSYRILFVFMTPLMGYATNVLTLNGALLAVGIGGGICLLVGFLGLRRTWSQIPSQFGR